MRELPEMQMMQEKHGPNEHQSIIICIYPDEKIRNIRNSQKDNVNLLQTNSIKIHTICISRLQLSRFPKLRPT